MRLLSAFFVVLFAFSFAAAQEPGEPYQFKDVARQFATPVKNQQSTGTCWAFSCASFFESEAYRNGKGEVNLSEMWVVRHTYRLKCENYVRRQGTAQFGEGGLGHDLVNAVKAYGIVPEDLYPGRKSPNDIYDHSDMANKLKKICDEAVADGKKGELSPDWLNKVDQVLDEKFGALPPAKFTVNNLPFTPQRYRDYLGIIPDNYVSITSFTHHPFWSTFILEVPDNFSNGEFYNIPLDQMMATIDYALRQGFTIEWDADVSNTGFSPKNGIAIVPAIDWKNKTDIQREATFKYWEKEKDITQAYRQEQFDRQATMDDHLMHITGLTAQGEQGDLFYIVKNSWGDNGAAKGYLNVSAAYMKLNTISILVHKNAIPADIKERLGLGGNRSSAPATPEIETPASGASQPAKSPKKSATGAPTQDKATMKMRPKKGE